MSDPVEVAIEKALLARLAAFAAAQSPALTVAYPNVDFTKPAVSKTAQWLRAAYIPATLFPIAIGDTSNNQHFGLFQVDAMQGQGIGELAPARLASLLIAYFTRGTSMTSDGFTIRVLNPPYRGPLMQEDPWAFVPVRIPYNCFATPA